jgi:phosphoribosylglycinamide formyltransferase 2
MGVVLSHDILSTPIEKVIERAKETAKLITVNS